MIKSCIFRSGVKFAMFSFATFLAKSYCRIRHVTISSWVWRLIWTLRNWCRLSRHYAALCSMWSIAAAWFWDGGCYAIEIIKSKQDSNCKKKWADILQEEGTIVEAGEFKCLKIKTRGKERKSTVVNIWNIIFRKEKTEHLLQRAEKIF